MVGIIILWILAAVVAVVITRTLLGKAKGAAARAAPAPVESIDADGAAKRLSALIRDKTVSHRDNADIDAKVFEAFRQHLVELYPEAHKALSRTIIDGHSMLYRWKGSKAGDPLVIMSHYDVVPAEDTGWIRPSFSGDIHEGKVWGRGSIDTKCTLVCALDAVESLVKSGFAPERDVYLSFGHNEETSGGGTPAIVKHLTGQGIKPGLVLDEGGAVVTGIFPGVSKPLAMVGVAEKGVTDFELSVKSAGGHSSTPPSKGAAWRLAKAIMRLESHQFKASFPPATKLMFERLGPHASFGLKLIFANMWLFQPLLLRVFGSGGGELAAICRTTMAVTMLEGSPAANVLPATARAVVNVRLAIGMDAERAMRHMKDAIDDPLVEMRILTPGAPSPVSELSGDRFDALSATIADVYPDAIVAPYIVLGGTDARHYSEVSRHVYRFSPFELSKAERASMHAVNEAIPVASLAKGIDFYIRLIRRAG